VWVEKTLKSSQQQQVFSSQVWRTRARRIRTNSGTGTAYRSRNALSSSSDSTLNLRFAFGVLILSPGLDQEVQAPLSRKRKSISRTNGQDPVSRSGKATGSGAFDVQSAQAISAAYYFDLAARDYILADGAIELLIERVPCSAFIEPSQSCELIF
jgi:hypothetical protein